MQHNKRRGVRVEVFDPDRIAKTNDSDDLKDDIAAVKTNPSALFLICNYCTYKK